MWELSLSELTPRSAPVAGAGAAESRAKLAALQPWLNGLTAVTGFLLLAFGALVVHRLVKSRRYPDEPDYEKQTSL
uniref:Uncharacterized protein n=1 Tax=Salarias fasciatus TaxID=181472 RepID=A0A672F8X7_SALFA